MSTIDRAAKRFAPALARIVPYQATRNIGMYADILQGKGSGTGWDRDAEAAAAATALRGVDRPVVVDGGANHGQWATSMHRALCGRPAAFYLFEPASACQEALSALPFGATVVRAALGAEPGEAVLSGAAPGYLAASLYERRDTYFPDMRAHQERVGVVTLDDVAAEYGLQRIDLLKLDVEGAEMDALRGARASLDRGAVGAIAFEFGSANIYSRTFFRDFWDLLTSVHFRLSRILPGGRLLPIDRYGEELEHFRGVSNYLAVQQR